MTLRDVDACRLGEAFRLFGAVGEHVWGGWSEAAPFGVLLVTDEHEYLLRYDDPPDDFEAVGFSDALGCLIWRRGRIFDTGLTAAFPAFDGDCLVVVGRPEAVGRSSTSWVLMVLHEHFHQFQESAAGYLQAVRRLDLAGDDRTGMWMLDYPFPYEDPAVGRAFADVCRGLASALAQPTSPTVRSFWVGFVDLCDRLKPKDRRYMEFQLWKEGVARYAELRAAQVAADGYQPSSCFRDLPDAEPYAAVADALLRQVLDGLQHADLRRMRRECFYACGAGVAMLMDAHDPEWKARYLHDMFVTGADRYVV